MKNKIIISLSTIPSRVDSIEPVLISLVEQTLEPDLIYINYPKTYVRFDDTLKIPDFINTNPKLKNKVKFYQIENDYGPATKFIGNLINDEIDDNDFLLITDDDIIKSKDWAKMLYDKFISLKQDYICCFEERKLGKKIIWGYLGYIFKKKMINLNSIKEFFDEVKSECFFVDDHWFTGYCHYKSIPIFNLEIPQQSEINLSLNGKDSLVFLEGDNSRLQVSERCRSFIKDNYDTEFPFWCCLGCCKKGKRRVIEKMEDVMIASPSQSIKGYNVSDKNYGEYKSTFANDEKEPKENDSINEWELKKIYNEINSIELPEDSIIDDEAIRINNFVSKRMNTTKNTVGKECRLIFINLIIYFIVIYLLILFVQKVNSKEITNEILISFSEILKVIFVKMIFPLSRMIKNLRLKRINFVDSIDYGIKAIDYIISLIYIFIVFQISIKMSCFMINKIYPSKKYIENFQDEIPKVIIQTYFDKKKIPDKVYKNIQKYAPEFKHIVMDDDEIIDFLKNNYKKDVLITFNYLKGAHKADLFRYCYLYKHGGIYLDIKTELIKPISEIFGENYTYSVLSIVRNTVYQGVIATPAGNPLFLKLIKFMVKIAKSKRKYSYILFTKDFWNNVYKECNMTPIAGVNKNVENINNNYYLFQEVCSKDESLCYDGLDRHKLCCYICKDNEKIIKSRYADFPW